MLEIYVDATCESWQTTLGKAKGKILIYSKKGIVEEEFEIEDLHLRQFINRFEFEAIRRGWSLYKNKRKIVYSDSQVAVTWAQRDGINCAWIPREKNLAGKILEYGPDGISKKISGGKN
jgi:hypothetical protein